MIILQLSLLKCQKICNKYLIFCATKYLKILIRFRLPKNVSKIEIKIQN